MGERRRRWIVSMARTIKQSQKKVFKEKEKKKEIVGMVRARKQSHRMRKHRRKQRKLSMAKARTLSRRMGSSRKGREEDISHGKD